MNNNRLVWFSLMFCMALSTPLHAELEVGKLFSDHMVLQRDKVNRVWGWAGASAPVEVCIAGECFKDKADETGAWEVSIPARSAGGPFDFKVSSRSKKIAFKDIYFGDVWLAGGQSNMEWKLEQKIDNLEAEYADSDYPLIRFFEVENRVSFEKEERLNSGSWVTASRKTLPGFSAVAWIFAKQNHKDKNVAVGIINDNWGGTPAEAWTSREMLNTLPAYRERTENLYADPVMLETQYANNKIAVEEKYRRLSSRQDALNTGAFRFGFDDSEWMQLSFPSVEPFEHLAWFRKKFELQDVPVEDAILDLGDLAQEVFIFVNEELITYEDWSDIGSRHKVSPSVLRKGENLITLRIGNSWNNLPGIGSQGNMHLEIAGERIPLNEGWTYSNTVEPPLPIERRFEHEATWLYNGMIHPVRRYAMRGVIWYQGEANVEEAHLYGDLFKAMINNWREASGQELVFLFVQLAGFETYIFPQPDSWRANIRYQQEQALDLPLTGMATAVDIGEEYNIHPTNKRDVALRLWLQARKVAFGEDIQADAPRVTAYKVKGNKVELQFDEKAGTLELRGNTDKVQAFILAGEDGSYHAAQAELKGSTITVWSDDVLQPRSLKYAWSNFPRVNLYSTTGLPVLPFKIDQL